MNLLAAWGPTIASVVVLIFTYGRLSQKQDDNREKLGEHGERIDKLDGHVQRIDIALVRLEEYNRGFTDATAISAKNRHAS